MVTGFTKSGNNKMLTVKYRGGVVGGYSISEVDEAVDKALTILLESY